MERDRIFRTSAILLFVLAFNICMATESRAENKAGSTTLTIFGGGYTPDSDLDLDTGFTGGLGIGYNLTENVGLEAVFNYVDSKYNGDVVVSDKDVPIYLYRLDLLYHLMPEGKVVPYLAVGAGGITYDPDARGVHTETDFLANYGLGVKFFLTPAMALRGDVRHVITFVDRNDDADHGDSNSNLLYTLGLTFAFGGKEEMKEETKEEVKEVVVAPVAPLDSDNDGVTDDLDKCPGTPSGVKVDKVGCPLDTDGDGVPDYLDKCPDTTAGVQVDKNGCPPVAPPPVVEKGAYVFRNILFDYNKSTIKPESEPILDEVAEFLKANPGMKMEIQGHADSIGSAGYNQKLSERRAAAVKAYLVKDEAVKGDRLTTKGYGLTMPVASNDTAEGRAKNRRVEFKPME
ncbi:MAG TPA: outer membrane beta-barrel domain-containing protein [Deltaproteobacteria bacterium]|nr:outer membrane beta-barrel domain-containing protein [Deltaproteobacteria bacterium]